MNRESIRTEREPQRPRDRTTARGGGTEGDRGTQGQRDPRKGEKAGCKDRKIYRRSDHSAGWLWFDLTKSPALAGRR